MKTFDYLYDIPVTNTKIHQGYTYLPWEQCLVQFRKAAELASLEFNFEATEWTPQSPSGDRYAIVHITVKADDREWKLAYPVMAGDLPIANPNSFDIHVAHQRAFVKCVAINSGFGLKLWVEKGGQEPPAEREDLSVEILKLFDSLIQKFGDPKSVHKELGISDSEMGKLIKGGPYDKQKELLLKMQTYFQDDIMTGAPAVDDTPSLKFDPADNWAADPFTPKKSIK